MAQQTEQKTISEILDIAIVQCIKTKYNGEPEVILMHHQTYDKLCNDYKSCLSYFDTHDVNVIKYRGIKIVRSLDILEDEVKIY